MHPENYLQHVARLLPTDFYHWDKITFEWFLAPRGMNMTAIQKGDFFAVGDLLVFLSPVWFAVILAIIFVMISTRKGTEQ